MGCCRKSLCSWQAQQGVTAAPRGVRGAGSSKRSMQRYRDCRVREVSRWVAARAVGSSLLSATHSICNIRICSERCNSNSAAKAAVNTTNDASRPAPLPGCRLSSPSSAPSESPVGPEIQFTQKCAQPCDRGRYPAQNGVNFLRIATLNASREPAAGTETVQGWWRGGFCAPRCRSPPSTARCIAPRRNPRCGERNNRVYLSTAARCYAVRNLGQLLHCSQLCNLFTWQLSSLSAGKSATPAHCSRNPRATRETPAQPPSLACATPRAPPPGTS